MRTGPQLECLPEQKSSPHYLSGREILFNGQQASRHLDCARLKFPIVLLRGLGRSSAFWLGFGDNLSTSSEVFMLDLWGTGRSQPENGWNFGRGSVEEHAQDVARTLKNLGIENCHLVGISFGGMVAAAAANMMQPKSLTVIASSARFTGETRIQKKALRTLLGELWRTYPRHKNFAEYLVSEKFLAEHKELISIWDELAVTEGFKRVPVFRQLLGAGLLWGEKEFRSVQCPTLFVVSKNDGLVDWRNTPVLWQTVPRSKMLYLEGFGHDIPTEAPQMLAEELSRFMRGVENNREV